MSQWSLKNPPQHQLDAVATAQGWTHPVTGEILVFIANLTTKKTDASGVPTFTLALPANGTYNAGQTLTFTITASEAVAVSGTPSITLTIGATSRDALFDAAASTGTSLVFKYTLVAGDVDADGITVANTINLNTTGKGKSKVIDVIADSTGEAVAAAALTYTVGSTAGILAA